MSAYSLQDGLFTGQTLTVPAAEAALSNPPGCAWVDGYWSPDQWRVDLDSGTVVRKSQDRPEDCGDFTWVWSDEYSRWLPRPTFQRERADKLEEIDREIQTAECGVDRALRELVLASGLPPAALDRMRAIDDAVARLRERRSEILAAVTMEQLLAVKMPSMS